MKKITIIPREIRELSFVPRWSIVRTLRTQNVAEHSYYVSLYTDIIADILEWKGDRAALLKMALWHDIEETYTADMPGPVKVNFVDKNKLEEYTRVENRRRFGELPLVEVEGRERSIMKAIIKVADLLEETLYLCGEISMGNSTLEGVCKMSSARLHGKVMELKGYFTADKVLELDQVVTVSILQEKGALSKLP